MPETSTSLTPEQQIATSRSQIEAQKAQLAEAAKQFAQPLRRVKSKEPTPLERRVNKEVRRVNLRNIDSLRKSVESSEAAYELDVAKSYPEQASPEYKQAALNEAVSNIQSKINTLSAQIATKTESMNNYLSWWNGKSSDYRHDEGNKESKNERIDAYEDEIEEIQKELDAYKDASRKGENDLIKEWYSGYTRDYADYQRDRKQARNEQVQAFEYAKRNDPQLKEIITVLNLPANVSQGKLQQALVAYNANVAKQQAALKTALDPWQKANPTEKLVFDKVGNVVGVQSGKLGQSISIENYKKLVPQASLPQSLNSNLSLKSNAGTSSISNLLASGALPDNRSIVTFGITGSAIGSGSKMDLSKIKEPISKSYQKGKELVGNIWDWAGKFDVGIPIFIGAGGTLKTEDIRKIGRTGKESLISDQFDKAVEDVTKKEKEVTDAEKALDKYPIIGGQWVGTEAQYKQYLIDFSNYEKKLDSYGKSYENYEKRAAAVSSLKGFDVIKEGGKGLIYRGLANFPTTGQIALGAAATYGGWRLAGKPLLQLTNYLTSSTAGQTALFETELYFASEGIKGFKDSMLAPEQRVLGLGTSILSGISFLGTGKNLLTSIPRGTGKVPTLSTQADNLPYVRKRATVLIEDSNGRVLYHVDKNTGLSILPGGAINKGESALNAAKRELFEETGLKIKLKPFDKVVTEREANYIYKAVVDDLNKLIPTLNAQAKEVVGFRALNPGNYTGRSQLNVFGSRGVRAEDLYIGSRAKAINEINEQIARFTLVQKTILTNQAKEELTRLFGKQALMLSKDNLLREYLLMKKGMQYRKLYINPVRETFTRAGKPVFLKRRVEKPSLRKPSSIVDFLTGKKPGQFKKFQKEAPIAVGFGSRYDVPFKRLKEYEDNLLTYLHGSPGRIKTDLEIYGEANPADLLTGRVNIKSDETFKVLKSKAKRGEDVLYFHPPATPTGEEAYLGASYLGLLRKVPKITDEVTIGFTRGSPTIYRVKAAAGKDLIFTQKARAGVEFEVGAQPGKVFKIVGKPEYVNLGGRRVKIQNIEIKNAGRGLDEREIQEGLSRLNRMNPQQKNNFLKKVKSQTGRDYYYLSQQYDVNPVQAVNQILLPAKAQPQQKRPSVQERRGESQQKARRSSEGRVSEDASELLIWKSGLRIPGSRPPKSKPLPSKKPYKFLDNYILPKIKYKPREGTEYKTPPSRPPYKPKAPYVYKRPPYNPLPPKVPPRYPPTNPFRTLINFPDRNRMRYIPKRRTSKSKHELEPTLANLLYNRRRRTPIRINQLTGFEVLRI